MFKFFKKTKKEPENLKEVLRHLERLEKDHEKISRELECLKKESKFFVQKIGVVRFNPFKEIGGDQSFSIALLDGNNDGIVLTSHYGREFNRIYAKPVKGGQSKYSLSDEEKKALGQAIVDNSKCKNQNAK